MGRMEINSKNWNERDKPIHQCNFQNFRKRSFRRVLDQVLIQNFGISTLSTTLEEGPYVQFLEGIFSRSALQNHIMYKYMVA